MKYLLPLLMMLLAAAVHADPAASAAPPIQDSDARKSRDGFTGAILATTDANWKEKWNSPGDVKPDFTPATSVPQGKPVYVLLFFANPRLDDAGQANVRCDFRITSPEGKVTLDQKDASCYAGKYEGGPADVSLAPAVINFSGEPSDPTGQWIVEVTLRDATRNVELPLRTGFTLTKAPARAAAPARKKARK